MAAIPPGGTLLDTFKKSFTDVRIDADKNNAIRTDDFLDAAESLTGIFDALGSITFAPVKNDMLGNIEKLRERQNKVRSDDLQDLVANELKDKSHTASEGLLWLTRGLEFTCVALSHNVADENKNVELADSFRTAYAVTLKPHHGFFAQQLFKTSLKAGCPYRQVFYDKLGKDMGNVMTQLREYLTALGKIVAIIKSFLSSYGTNWKV